MQFYGNEKTRRGGAVILEWSVYTSLRGELVNSRYETSKARRKTEDGWERNTNI